MEFKLQYNYWQSKCIIQLFCYLAIDIRTEKNVS